MIPPLLPPLRDLNSELILEINKKLTLPVKCCCQTGRGVSASLASYDRYGIGVKIRFCLQCGTAYISPYLGEKEIAEFYRDDYQCIYGRAANSSQVKLRQSKRADLFSQVASLFFDVRRFGDKFSILEIGSSFGVCIQAVSQNLGIANTKLAIIEPSLEQARGIAASQKNIQVLNCLEEVSDNSLNLVFCDHVLEHILDVKYQLKLIEKKLNHQAGIFVFAVPILERFMEIRNKPYAINFHVAHVRYFSICSLSILLRSAGLRVYEVTGNCTREEGEGLFVALSSNASDWHCRNLSNWIHLVPLTEPPLFLRLAVNSVIFMVSYLAIRVSRIKNALRLLLGSR